MKKRVMCVHTELVREGSVLYEGKDGNTGITTTEEAAGFAASFFGKQDKELLYVCAVNGELEPVLMELVAKGSKNVCYAEPADILSQQSWRMHTVSSVFITTREEGQKRVRKI